MVWSLSHGEYSKMAKAILKIKIVVKRDIKCTINGFVDVSINSRSFYRIQKKNMYTIYTQCFVLLFHFLSLLHNWKKIITNETTKIRIHVNSQYVYGFVKLRKKRCNFRWYYYTCPHWSLNIMWIYWMCVISL